MVTHKMELKMTIFDGTGDFGIWKKRMLANLSVQGLKDVIVPQSQALVIKESGEEDEDTKKKKDQDEAARLERDEKTMNLIFMSVGDHVLRKLDKCSTALEAWELLDRLYMAKTLPSRVHAQLKVYSFRMQDLRSIDQNVDDFLKLITDLNNLNIEIPEEVQAILLLNALPSRYDSLKETLKYSREAIRVYEIASAARSKEMEYKETSTVKLNGEGNYARGRSESRSRVSFAGKDKHRSRSESKDGKRLCWICGKEGHFKRQCYKWLERNKDQKHNQDQGEASLAKDDARDLVGLLVAEVNSVEVDRDEWVLDTGCYFHMTPRRDVFIDLQESASGRVRMANNISSEIKGVGSVRFQNPDGTTFLLQDVRYMPDISRNLISMGTLEEKGCEFKGSNGLLQVLKGCTMFMKGVRHKSLYILQAKAKTLTAYTVESSSVVSSDGIIEDTRLWHSRLGHLGQKGMEILKKRNCFGKSQVKELGFCEDCVIGKTHKIIFSQAKHVTKDKLDYIHSDLWGSPNVPPSLSKKQYFISFTDDYSRKVWLYFLRFKDEAFQSFVAWKKMVEVQSERKIKRLRTDNGLEFCNQSMDKLCRDSGIKRHKTCPYTPQQNGVSERMNRSIMDKVRSMLHETGLDASYWTEAASTTVYLINRSPNSSIEFEIPEVKWSGRSISYDHLRSFGCNSYVHQVKEKTSARATKGVFMGYAEGTKGYIIWLFSEEKIVISKDVVFNEQSFYKDMKKDDDPDVTTEETTKSKGKKKVSFKSVLVEVEGDDSNSGGAVSKNSK